MASRCAVCSIERWVANRPPTYLSADHDPLYRFHQWQANLRILDVAAIKAVPYGPLSHPFVERLIGTIRRECLDRTLFWTAADLDVKLRDFQRYFNGHRTHAGLSGLTPEPRTGEDGARANVSTCRWQPHRPYRRKTTRSMFAGRTEFLAGTAIRSSDRSGPRRAESVPRFLRRFQERDVL